MSCLRSIVLARRTTASSARSIIRAEAYHSGIRSFLWGVFGWQKSSGMTGVLCCDAASVIVPRSRPVAARSQSRLHHPQRGILCGKPGVQGARFGLDEGPKWAFKTKAESLEILKYNNILNLATLACTPPRFRVTSGLS